VLPHCLNTPLQRLRAVSRLDRDLLRSVGELRPEILSVARSLDDSSFGSSGARGVRRDRGETRIIEGVLFSHS